jgi:hypothetical protein
MSEIISEPPTRAEFDSCLSATGNTTVGGMSGLTYAMMKAWPEKVTATVFESMLQLWEQKETPGMVEMAMDVP